MPSSRTTTTNNNNSEDENLSEPQSRVQTLTLEQIKNYRDEKLLCNTWGIAVNNWPDGGEKGYQLVDPTIIDLEQGVEFELLGQDMSRYPRCKRGDIVRLHRVCLRKDNKPHVPTYLNVVVWPAFLEKPIPMSNAKRPSLHKEDKEKQRSLETIYSSTMDRIDQIVSDKTSDYRRIAGRVESRISDKFGNILIKLNDGSRSCDLRIFKPSTSNNNHHRETEEFFQIALRAKTGDFLTAMHVKYNSTKEFIDLSSNFKDGRCLRVVESSSILGNILKQYLNLEGEADLPFQEPATHQSNDNNSDNNNSQEQSQRPRRSPRLNPASQSPPPPKRKSPMTPRVEELNNNLVQIKQPVPEFTKLSDILIKQNKFDFYNLAGRVMGKPHKTKSFATNWIFQFSDGSMFNYVDRNRDQLVENPIEGCISIIVYGPDRDRDVDDHVRVAKTLENGDLVAIHNVKARWFSDRQLKLEMNANTSNNKKIVKVDKRSEFGEELLAFVQSVDDADDVRAEEEPE